ncbi:MAG: hypothetical protein AVDCRST_MAG59-4877 [uncultured Thermomicrobiales bacterium]|uniref:Uncharacterized protein n=1 Tax=uncultured Thermomicrobiales bacterium TaxID=1645740 RepID=A0A6J4VKS8_9BACT|nr:MAG: hypothetical protein AVDCRST_MAG59-4877 [uncultured Thermomicrobiales bacterium]
MWGENLLTPPAVVSVTVGAGRGGRIATAPSARDTRQGRAPKWAVPGTAPPVRGA